MSSADHVNVFSSSDCYKPTLPLGRFVATGVTFLASVLLHGFNFQLGAVLLSLGLFGYAESLFRRRLADILVASVAATRSPKDNYR